MTRGAASQVRAEVPETRFRILPGERKTAMTGIRIMTERDARDAARPWNDPECARTPSAHER